MQNIYLYILIASLTIASPGPGIILTLSNTLHYSLKKSFFGILGISSGMGVIAVIAASSIGIIITSSPIALVIVKIIGAVYLVYLGVKLFRSIPQNINSDIASITEVSPGFFHRFREGFFVSLFNPKPIVFFMALFPQFIDLNKPVVIQFWTLGITFCILVIIIHLVYALCAQLIKHKVKSGKVFIILNKVGGSIFIFFAMGLISSAIISIV